MTLADFDAPQVLAFLDSLEKQRRCDFSAISTNYGAGNFGQVTSALDPRIMEMVLRFQF